MSQSPLMYSVQLDSDEYSSYIGYLDLQPNTPWFRAIDLFEGCSPHMQKEFSMNRVLEVDFLKVDGYNFLYELLIHCKSIQIFFSPMRVKKNFSDHLYKSIQLENFDCYYALQCLLSYSFEVIDQLVVKKDLEIFKKFLEEKSKESALTVCKSFYIIYDALVKGNIIMFFQFFRSLYDKLLMPSYEIISNDLSDKNVSGNNSQNHLLFIKRVIATPTHFIFLPPQPTLKSRALRDCDPDYSLRLSIKDVDMNAINFTLKQGFFSNLNEKLIEFYNNHFKNPLLQGIKIGKRNYQYIGNSTSQLKGHGMWFYAKDEQNMSAKHLRKKFGELEKIKKVPKYMARMGQTFSQSMGNIRVPQEMTNVRDPEEDIKGGQKKYLIIEEENLNSKYIPEKFLKEQSCTEEKEIESDEESVTKEKATVPDEEETDPYVFSDGIGRISLELAEEIYEKLKLEEAKPCAIQIRYAGCKGMLVVDPELKGKKIMFRKSMKKFDSDDNSLEILKFSEKRVTCLNRPFITILEQLGVPKEVFLELQKDVIQNHITSMFDENAAYQFLNRNSLLRIDFFKMYSVGIHFTEDPLFRSMIYSLFQKQIEMLKTKASIEIPANKGRTFFGVLDETFTLEYGQVFIQYSDWETNEKIILQETVLVTKNPCMHPGDVRKFEAVDVKKLHHIVDCIVFPAKGDRPHPDEMAGSDLDGDEYSAIWLKSLIFSNENYKPMHYAQKDNKEDIDKPVTPSDELDHFGDYIFNDHVGLIANAHLVHADKCKGGIFSDVCLRLAKKYSISLDFAKSGKSIKIGKDRAYSYPDFMEKLDIKKTYLSRKALGYLFRSCKKLEMGLETERNEIDYQIDIGLRHDCWHDKYLKSAKRMLKQYSNKIDKFLNIYGFENEGQLLAGALINPPKYYENRHDMMNLMALLEHEVQWIFRDLERKFFSEFGGKPKDGNFTDIMHQKASAWYMVCYSKSNSLINDLGDSISLLESNNENKGCSYFGLPWAVADVLIDMRKKNTKKNIYNTKTILENVVDKSISKYMPEKLSFDTDSVVIHENRLEMLGVAYKVLTKWVKCQREHFTDFNFKHIEKIFSDEFQKLAFEISSCDVGYIESLKKSSKIKKAISPCYYIIHTILNIAKKGVHSTNYSDVLQEFGLLSWITLIKLSCTYNPQYLGIPNEAGEFAETVFYKAQNNIVDTIQLPLNEKNIPYNCEFTENLLLKEPDIKDYLMEITKLRDIEFRHLEGRDRSNLVRLTVRGTRYSIEKLKDIVVLDNFYEFAVLREHPFANNI